ncbi:MAG: polysaccharide deacetylase family protein [Alphaproteobacteria bacterium]|nr:polysaccharide deacetylase family protein [Alphaproteobacteria bacterium]
MRIPGFEFYIYGICLIAFCLHTGNALAATALPQDDNKAVILAYHRIGEDNAPGENLSAQQFNDHLEEIENGPYHVLPLSRIMEILSKGETLPPNTLAITFEGAYLSAYEKGMKALIHKNIPFTVFYASDTLDQNLSEYMDWDTLRALSKNKNITIGALPASYTHIAHEPTQEIIANLNKARQRYRDVFKAEADFLAYPFGEYSLELKKIARKQGFKYALGLHSGVTQSQTDVFALPRFSMTERYGDLERFQTIATALPLPISDLEPADPLLSGGAWIAGFTLPEALAAESDALSCFISGQKPPEIEALGPRIELRAAAPDPIPSRMRMNCTMPGPAGEDATPRWRWFGMLYHRNEKNVPNPPLGALQELQE